MVRRIHDALKLALAEWDVQSCNHQKYKVNKIKIEYGQET